MSNSLNLCTSGLFSLGVSEMRSFGWNESMPFISRSPADRHLSKDKLTMSHTTHRDGVGKCQGFEQKRTSALSKEIFPSLKAVPQPMPDCTLWNNVAVKLTNVIGFSFHDNTAFVISRSRFPASSNLEGFTFFKMRVCVQKGPYLIFLWVFSSSSFSYKVRMLGSPLLYSLSTLSLTPYQGKKNIIFTNISEHHIWHLAGMVTTLAIPSPSALLYEAGIWF